MVKLDINSDISSIFRSRWKLKLFFITHLPMAFLSGLKIKAFDEERAVVTLPYSYLTKNPFRSVYFACQAMAAEFSSAIICLQTLEKYESDLSLLVIGIEAKFIKKATQKISFSCERPEEQDEILDHCISHKSSREITYISTGRNMDGEKVSEFHITWSFKPRS